MNVHTTMRRGALMAALSLAASGLTVTGHAPAAAAAACEYPASGDINADGTPDPGVGVPNDASGAGAVDIAYDRARSPVRYTAAALGFPGSAAGDRFGAAVLVNDLDEDGCSDLLIGAPGANAGAGRVYVAWGRPTGLATVGGRMIASPAASASFGSALTSFRASDGDRVIVIGAPGYDDAGATNAGAIYTTGVPAMTGTLGPLSRITQNSSGIADSSEAGDAFGAVLSGTLVGMPSEDLGATVDAGAVMRLVTRATAPYVASSQRWSQDSTGVAGVPEPGDRFGASVADGLYAAVGVPGEDLGTTVDAGAVQLFIHDSTTSVTGLRAYRSYDQDTSGVPGVGERGDRFGSAVATGDLESGESGWHVWIGAPGEDVGSAVDAGAVTRLYLPGSSGASRPHVGLTSGGGLPGIPETGDRLGATLGTVADDYIMEEDGSTSLLIGVPGEDRGSVRDSGWVIFSRYSFVSSPRSAGLVNPALPGEHYGQVLGS